MWDTAAAQNRAPRSLQHARTRGTAGHQPCHGCRELAGEIKGSWPVANLKAALRTAQRPCAPRSTAGSPPPRISHGSRDPPGSLPLSINRTCPDALGKYSDKPSFPYSADSRLSQNSEATTQNSVSSETLKECHRLSQKPAEAS